jgi:putative transposase
MVERFQKTLNDDVAHGIPGTTFSNVLDKEDYDPAKHAIVRYSKILEIVNKWVADVYHQRRHRSLQVSPQQCWVSSVAPEDILLPNDPRVLDALLGRSEERVLTHKGIELDCLTYNAPELTSLRKQYGDKLRVQLRIDDADIGQITVICPHTGDLYTVPAVRADYASGISRWQHNVFKKFAATRDDRSDPEAWLEAKHEISKMVEEEFLVKKKGTRSRVARFKHAANRRPDTTDQLDDGTVDSENGYSEQNTDLVDKSTVVGVEDVVPSEDITFKPIAPVVSIPDDRLACQEAS